MMTHGLATSPPDVPEVQHQPPGTLRSHMQAGFMHQQVTSGNVPLGQHAWQLAGLTRVLRQQVSRVVVVLITADIGRRGRLGYVCSCAVAHVHLMLTSYASM